MDVRSTCLKDAFLSFQESNTQPSMSLSKLEGRFYIQVPIWSPPPLTACVTLSLVLDQFKVLLDLDSDGTIGRGFLILQLDLGLS